MNKQSKHMFLYEFDQEGRRAMILQLGNFKGNVTWFLFFEYLIDLNAVISKAAELRNRRKTPSRRHCRCFLLVAYK